MSAPGKYQPPTFQEHVWSSKERRDAKPFGQLARKLYDISRNASDPFELAAHLEALGYNNKRTSEEFGVETPFALARQLFYASPRRPELGFQNPLINLKLGWYQLSLVVTIMATIGLHQSTLASNWIITLWLITWSIVSTSLVYRAQNDLKIKRREGLFTALLGLGAAGLAALWFSSSISLADLSMAVLWTSVSACLWLEQLLGKNRYWLKMALLNAVAFTAFAGWGLPTVFALLLAASFMIFVPHLRFVRPKMLTWITKEPFDLALYTAYGSGLGLVFIRLLQVFEKNLWLGGGLLILFLFLAEWVTLNMRESLAKTMWTSQSQEEFGQQSLSSSFFSLPSLAFFVALTLLLLLQVFVPAYSSFISHFVLFGLSMAFVLLLFGLNNTVFPALVFVSAGVLSVFGAPLIWLLVVLALLLMLALLVQLHYVEEYGFYIVR